MPNPARPEAEGQRTLGTAPAVFPRPRLEWTMGKTTVQNCKQRSDSCYRQPLVEASGLGLEAGGELEAGRELFLTVAAVPTAILATEESL